MTNNTGDHCEGGFEVSGENPVVRSNKVADGGDEDGFRIACFDLDAVATPTACAAAEVCNNSATAGPTTMTTDFDILCRQRDAWYGYRGQCARTENNGDRIHLLGRRR